MRITQQIDSAEAETYQVAVGWDKRLINALAGTPLEKHITWIGDNNK